MKTAVETEAVSAVESHGQRGEGNFRRGNTTHPDTDCTGGRQMELPQWVEDDIELLPKDFSGQIVIEVWEGGVTRRDIVNRRQAPKIAAETLPRDI